MRTEIGADDPDDRTPAVRVEFSPRELQIIGLIAEGRSEEEIARALGLSTYTIRNHGISIRRKTERKRWRETGQRPWDRDNDASS